MVTERIEARLLSQLVNRGSNVPQPPPCCRSLVRLGQPSSERDEVLDRLFGVVELSWHNGVGSARYRPERGVGSSWSVSRLSIQASTASEDTKGDTALPIGVHLGAGGCRRFQGSACPWLTRLSCRRSVAGDLVSASTRIAKHFNANNLSANNINVK